MFTMRFTMHSTAPGPDARADSYAAMLDMVAWAEISREPRAQIGRNEPFLPGCYQVSGGEGGIHMRGGRP